MKEKQSFAIQTFVAVLVLNAVLLAAAYFVGGPAVIFGGGVVITLALWFAVQTIGKKHIDAAARPAALPAERPALPKQPTPAPKP